MTAEEIGFVMKRFEQPDEVRQMKKGKFEIVNIGGMTIGKATYEPGWKWSEHVGPSRGQKLCPVEHLGIVISGIATVAFEHAPVQELKPGTVFHVPSTPHDSWVVGDEQYVSLHFLGADKYSK
jgi:quercetin dioxygenase-like cupin family protein